MADSSLAHCVVRISYASSPVSRFLSLLSFIMGYPFKIRAKTVLCLISHYSIVPGQSIGSAWELQCWAYFCAVCHGNGHCEVLSDIFRAFVAFDSGINFCFTLSVLGCKDSFIWLTTTFYGNRSKIGGTHWLSGFEPILNKEPNSPNSRKLE